MSKNTVLLNSDLAQSVAALEYKLSESLNHLTVTLSSLLEPANGFTQLFFAVFVAVAGAFILSVLFGRESQVSAGVDRVFFFAKLKGDMGV